MPSASELARVDEERATYTDDEMILDGLKTRAKGLGYDSIGDALAALDAFEAKEREEQADGA